MISSSGAIGLFAALFAGLFPLFLLLGLLSYVTARWRDWLVNSHTVQAALHDVGVLVGASIVAPDERANETIYELYRLLNAVHAVLYKSVVPHLPQDVAGLVDLGLLTSGEAELLEPTANKQRDVLVTWAGQKGEALTGPHELLPRCHRRRGNIP